MENATTLNIDAARDLIAAHAGPDRVPKRFKVHTDTSDFFRVEYNDVVLLGSTPFWVKRYEKEGRFGLDDEPKYWVRRAIDLGFELNVNIHSAFFDTVPLIAGGTCSWVIPWIRTP